MEHGGKRENSGRKKLPAEQKSKAIKYYLYEHEKRQVDSFVLELKKARKS